ncbi:MAG: proton-conducting transporter membrane subunit [Bacillota bacterium]|nr:proton-conducting transporter membrane subunit [Bacillota bacterium]
MYIYLAAVILVIMILNAAIIKNVNVIAVIQIVMLSILTTITFILGQTVIQKGHISLLGNLVYIDSLNLIQLFIITTVSLTAAVYSRKYINNSLADKEINLRKAKIYYILFTTFVFSMLFLSVSNNIMAMWIGLEATTLATAFLIGFHNSKLSLEAAWKYIILCSIGIAIGLIGIILFIYGVNRDADPNTLQWTFLMGGVNSVHKGIIKVAFTFIFIGIGTKVGFAPMHTWLSDGHSEAPSPISAMMSGALINLALYVIVRFYVIVRHIDGIQNLKYLFIVFGCISLVVSTFSILRQSNYKRLLAFSSVENMGIISLGFGFGGFAGIFGALLHSIIHAYGKSLLFLVSGNILSAYKTKRTDKINALIKTMPINALFLIVGMLVIVGMPPFAAFFSEFNIFAAGVDGGHFIAVSLLAFCLLIAFAGFLNAFIRMVFQHEGTEYRRMEKDKENVIPLIITMALILLVSCAFNNYLYKILSDAVAIING